MSAGHTEYNITLPNWTGAVPKSRVFPHICRKKKAPARGVISASSAEISPALFDYNIIRPVNHFGEKNQRLICFWEAFLHQKSQNVDMLGFSVFLPLFVFSQRSFETEEPPLCSVPWVFFCSLNNSSRAIRRFQENHFTESEPAGAQELLIVMPDHCCICLSARHKKSGVLEVPLKQVFKESPGSFWSFWFWGEREPQQITVGVSRVVSLGHVFTLTVRALAESGRPPLSNCHLSESNAHGLGRQNKNFHFTLGWNSRLAELTPQGPFNGRHYAK